VRLRGRKRKEKKRRDHENPKEGKTRKRGEKEGRYGVSARMVVTTLPSVVNESAFLDRCGAKMSRGDPWIASFFFFGFSFFRVLVILFVLSQVSWR
jgi:hypothetical protein